LKSPPAYGPRTRPKDDNNYTRVLPDPATGCRLSGDLGSAAALRSGAFITPGEERERLWSRVRANAKPVKGVEAKQGIEWLKPGLIARVGYLKGEAMAGTLGLL